MEELLAYLSSVNFSISPITLDGKIHRVSRDGKENAWYIGWQNHYIGGDGTYIVAQCGDWKTNESYTYKPTKKLSKEDSAVIKHQLESARKISGEAKSVKQSESAAYSLRVWDALTTTQTTTDYISRKKIATSFGVKIDERNAIHIPMKDIDGKFWGMQRIFHDGAKRFITGQRVQGCFFVFGELVEDLQEVYVCEGWATGSTIHELVKKTVIVAFNAGNLKNVCRDIHLAYPMTKIIICADNDRFGANGKNVGIESATEAASSCSGVIKVPIFKSDEAKGTDFNDLYLEEGTDSVKNQLIEVEEAKSGFVPLGYVGHDYYFYSMSNKDVVCVSSFSTTQLFALAPSGYWSGSFPSKTGIKWDEAKDHLVQTSRACGIFDRSRQRGTGVWEDRGRIVVNTGNVLMVNGKVTPMTSIKSRYVYIKTLHNIPSVHANPLTVEESQKLIDVCAMFNWEKIRSGAFLAGWIAVARIAGALPVRPHVWVSGEAGSGKSTILEALVKRGLGDNSAKLYGAGGTTEAGIRQTMQGTSIPMIFDEFETTDAKETNARVDSILEMLRQSWKKNDSKVYKGSADGTAQSYTIQFAALVASIQVNLKNQADRTRFCVLELDAHNQRPDQWELISKAITDITEDYGERLFSRMVHMAPTILKSHEIIRDSVPAGMTRRFGEQVGMLLAGYWALYSDSVVTTEEALGMISDLDLGEEKSRQLSDQNECANFLITSTLDVQAEDGTRVRMSLEEILRLNNSNHKELLRSSGILDCKKGLIFVRSTHAGVASIFRNTRWATSYSTVLTRLKHNEKRHYWDPETKKTLYGVFVDLNKM